MTAVATGSSEQGTSSPSATRYRRGHGRHALNEPVVGMAPTPDGVGTGSEAADGGMFKFGDAGFFGSAGSLHLNKSVVGMAPTHDGEGYWMVASDGGIFAYGDAPFEGSMGSHHLNKPIVGMVPTHDGRGYWMVASDGGIFAFGDAPFEGSLGARPPQAQSSTWLRPPTTTDTGWWPRTARSTRSVTARTTGQWWVAAPATSLAATPAGGYWVLTSDGGGTSLRQCGELRVAVDGPASAVGRSEWPTTTTDAPSGAASGAPRCPAVGRADIWISALTPSSGTAGGGDTIEISGSGISGATAVEFGNNGSSDYTVNSPTAPSRRWRRSGQARWRSEWSRPPARSKPTRQDKFTYVPTGQSPITAQARTSRSVAYPPCSPVTTPTSWPPTGAPTPGAVAWPPRPRSTPSSPRSAQFPRAVLGLPRTMAMNINTHQLDWQPLDNVFYAAAKYHVYLIPAISDQAGTCDGGHWQDPAWYSGGFMDVYNSATNSDGRGLTPLSYWNYMNALVSRYADSPALGMWEPMSEAEASTCPAARAEQLLGQPDLSRRGRAAAALEYFFTTVGAQIHRLDPTHLVEAAYSAEASAARPAATTRA